MNAYSFSTTFSLPAHKEQVWDALSDFTSWHQWWKPVRSVVPDASDPHVVTLTIGSLLYSLTFTLHTTTIDQYVYTAFDSTGDLVGTGSFAYTEIGGVTTVIFEWNIATTKQWMNRSVWVLRPVFVIAHNIVMRRFVRGLAKYLHTTVIAFHNTAR